jgi:hypothetical protein
MINSGTTAFETRQLKPKSSQPDEKYLGWFARRTSSGDLAGEAIESGLACQDGGRSSSGFSFRSQPVCFTFFESTDIRVLGRPVFYFQYRCCPYSGDYDRGLASAVRRLQEPVPALPTHFSVGTAFNMDKSFIAVE